MLCYLSILFFLASRLAKATIEIPEFDNVIPGIEKIGKVAVEDKQVIRP